MAGPARTVPGAERRPQPVRPDHRAEHVRARRRSSPGGSSNSPAGRSTHEVPGRTRRPGRRGCLGCPQPARPAPGPGPGRGAARGHVRPVGRPPHRLRLRLRDLRPRRAGRHDRRPGPGARLRAVARRHHPRAAGQARRRRGRRRAGDDLLRQQPVQPADHAGRGLSPAAGHAADRRCRAGRRAGPGRAAGRRRRGPRRHAADAHRDPPGDRRSPPHPRRHRPVPARGARAGVGPGGRRADHVGPDPRPHARGRREDPRRCGPGGAGAVGGRRHARHHRRRPPRHHTPARRRVPPVPPAHPDRAHQRRGPRVRRARRGDQARRSS